MNAFHKIWLDSKTLRLTRGIKSPILKTAMCFTNKSLTMERKFFNFIYFPFSIESTKEK